MLLRLGSLLLLVLVAPAAHAQQDGLLQIDDPLHRFLDRQRTGGLLPEGFLLHKPLSAYEARRYLDSLEVHAEHLSLVDRRHLNRFLGYEAAPGAVWLNRHIRPLYRNGTDFVAVDGEGYGLQVNPLLYLAAGRADRKSPDRAEVIATWHNTRGLRASGHIGPYLFFESRIEENQKHVVHPGAGQKTATRLGRAHHYPPRTLDYLTATGVLGVRTRFFEVRFGRDRNRWADGLNSLFLSNYADLYDQLQIRTTFWRLQYTNLFAAFADLSVLPPVYPDQTMPRKYGAFHQLAINLPGGVQAALFEAVVFGPDDVRGSGFDVSYLNPVVLLRAVEHDRGSPDNMLIGGSLSWVVRPGVQLYGQGLLTELKVDELLSGDGWWANKWGVMGGIHLTRLPVEGADLRFEYSRVRPFTYSHNDPTTGYIHYGDYVGHAAGQNFVDYVLSINYDPATRILFNTTFVYTVRGRDTDEENFGADPRRSYNKDRQRSHGHYILQGIRHREWLIEGHAGYEVLPGLTVELAARVESMWDAELGTDRYVEPFVLVRWGLPYKSIRY